jgi:FAD:protein FMN transferase
MRIMLLTALLVVGESHAQSLLLRGATMGTTYQIKLVAELATVDHERLQTDVDQVLAEIDRQMSTYRPDSELSRFNRAPAGEWFGVSSATAEVVAAAHEISEKTDGALDVTVGPLVRLWHFGPPDAANGNAKHKFTPPSDDAIATSRQHLGYKKLSVRIEPAALRKESDGLEVDLSSIASGYAIDRLADLLAKRGIEEFMVEIGGEVRAAGRREDGAPWRVAIERPLARGRGLQMAVPLEDAAIATAGDYRKFFEYAGRRYSHIIDPATGQPVEHALASVTVVSESCVAADGWDTPLLVLGPERGYECAERNGIAALFISRDDAGPNDSVRKTSAWQKKFAD